MLLDQSGKMAIIWTITTAYC